MEDKTLTQRIVDIFHPLGIKVLDHIIVADTSYTSMAEKGELPKESRSIANYGVIELGASTAKEKLNRVQHTHSR
jgi:DNA repair protein RadC